MADRDECLVAIAALIALTGIAQAATSKPDRLSSRSIGHSCSAAQALNQKYRLAPVEGHAAWHDRPRVSGAHDPQRGAEQAVRPRSVEQPASPQTPGVVSHGFAWGAFGIGAVAMLGLVLLAGGVIAGSRHGREAPRVRTS